jgi:glutamine amidotransferase
MAVPTDLVHRIADCVYGGHLVPAAIGRDRTTGCQFHPEKSGEVGLKILRRFCVD